MLTEKQKQAFDLFHNALLNDKILDIKTKIMIQLATAMALGCSP